MIRIVNPHELGEVAEVGKVFFKEAGLPGQLVSDIFCGNWSRMIKAGQGVIVGQYEQGIFVGGFGMVIAPDINDGVKVANECFWFVHPDHRIGGMKLLHEAMKVAKELSCKRFSIIHLCNEAGEKLSRIYNKLGFRPIETHYLLES